MNKIRKKITAGIIIIMMMVISGCGTEELVKEHINDQLAASGDVSYYASMDADARKSLCEEQHIQISGIVSEDGSYLLYIGEKKTDGLEVHCNFDDKIENVVKGDYVTVDGVCDDSFSDSMYVYGCRISEHIKQDEIAGDVTKEILVEDTTSATSEVIKAPIASYECEGKKYDEVEAIFKNAGFNVLLNAVEQNEGETLFKDGDVIIVAAGDKAVFEQDEEIAFDTEITIDYCVLMKSVEQTQQQTAEEEKKPAYSITDMTATMYVASTANIRSEPDKNASKLGTLSQNDEVAITGTVDNGWYRINYKGAEGYVKGDLLTTEKVVVQAPVVTQPSDENGNGRGSNGGGSSVTIPSVGDTQGDLVWIPTKGGTKYHSNSSCSNMDNPMQVTREHAEANGFTPCKRCH